MLLLQVIGLGLQPVAHMPVTMHCDMATHRSAAVCWCWEVMAFHRSTVTPRSCTFSPALRSAVSMPSEATSRAILRCVSDSSGGCWETSVAVLVMLTHDGAGVADGAGALWASVSIALSCRGGVRCLGARGRYALLKAYPVSAPIAKANSRAGMMMEPLLIKHDGGAGGVLYPSSACRAACHPRGWTVMHEMFVWQVCTKRFVNPST